LLKTALKQAFCWLAEVSRLSRVSQRPCVTVLAYHRIVNADPLQELCVSPDLFDLQVALLASAFRIISLEEAVMRLEKGDLESHCVALTFDDGWRDNYVHAFPVLKKYAVPATIFVTSDAISSGRFSWYEFDDAILQTSAASIDLEPYGLGRLPLRNARLRSAAVDRLHGILKDMEHSQRQEVAESVIRRYGRPVGSRIMLNWEELREMMASGLVAVGGHTISHPILTRISAEEARREISGCKTIVEENLGRPVRFFAYPNGTPADINRQLADLVREAGYVAAFGMTAGPNYSLEERFSLRRTAISNGVCQGVTGAFSPSMLATRVRGALGGLPFSA
jgi:peptidoglycan/xylan/chitin deacetylase (PgdA/CDA1 family)